MVILATSLQDNSSQVLLLEKQFCFSLYAANLAISKVYRTLLRSLGLTYSQYLVMLVLWEGDHLTLSDIGSRLYLDSATLTPLVKRLVSAGLVTKHRATNDERHVVIELTKAGAVLKAQALPLPNAVSCAIGCAVEEIEAMKTGLEKLRLRLSNLD